MNENNNRTLPDVETWMRDIVAERARQKAKGYDADHDRKHGFDGLLRWAQEYARRGSTLAAAALVEAARELLAEARVLPDVESVAREVQTVLDSDYLMRQEDRVAAILAARILALFSEQPTVDAVRREALAPVIDHINQRPEYVQALRNTRGDDSQSDYWRWQGHAEARRQLAQKLDLRVPYEFADRIENEGKEERK